jgi:hypothetical protein
MKAAELETHPATSQPVVGTESLQPLPRVLGGVMFAVASTPGGEDADAVHASSQQHVHQMDQRLALPWRRQIRLMDVSLRSIREPHGTDAPPVPPQRIPRNLDRLQNSMGRVQPQDAVTRAGEFRSSVSVLQSRAAGSHRAC